MVAIRPTRFRCSECRLRSGQHERRSSPSRPIGMCHSPGSARIVLARPGCLTIGRELHTQRHPKYNWQKPHVCLRWLPSLPCRLHNPSHSPPSTKYRPHLNDNRARSSLHCNACRYKFPDYYASKNTSPSSSPTPKFSPPFPTSTSPHFSNFRKLNCSLKPLRVGWIVCRFLCIIKRPVREREREGSEA